MTVVDASAVIDLLLPPDTSRQAFLIDELPDPAAPWIAPDVLPFEVFAAVRRHLLRGVLPETTASRALQRLARLPIELVPTLGLLPAAWSLRDRCAATDALYAALALRSAEPLLTTDIRLARAATEAGVTVRAP